MDTISSDPHFKDGFYDQAEMVPALKRQGNLWNVMGYSPEMFRQKAYQALGFDTAEAFA